MKPKINWNRPDIICLLVIPVWIALGLIAGNKTFDIQLHDTYFVIVYIRLVQNSIIVFGLYAFFYWLSIRFRKNLITQLTKTHLILSIIGFSIFLSMAAIAGTPEIQSSIVVQSELGNIFAILLFISIICILLGLALFLINMVIGIVSSLTKNQ